MEITSYLVWNVILSLIIAPIFYSIRQNAAENKRIDILINKTREEMARSYVTKQDLAEDIDRVISNLERLESKIDRIIGT
tara:strand:- start:6825 stop:7064 length:240 start_codon:yes stop_codon:yes gene_type:complete